MGGSEQGIGTILVINSRPYIYIHMFDNVNVIATTTPRGGAMHALMGVRLIRCKDPGLTRCRIAENRLQEILHANSY